MIKASFDTLGNAARQDGERDIPKYLNHHTITTGNSRKSFASEVPADLGLRQHVEKLLISTAPIPNCPGYYAKGRQVDGNIVVDVFFHKAVQVSFLVAVQNDQSATKEFRQLCHKDPLGNARVEPSAPYCSATIAFSPFMDPAAIFWIADYERCVAWEWLRMTSDLQKEPAAQDNQPDLWKGDDE